MAVSACTKVAIKDSEWCGDLGADGASCFHTLTSPTRDIEKAAWDQERFGMVCTRGENFGDWKKAIEELCHKSKDCDFQTREAINIFFAKIGKLRR